MMALDTTVGFAMLLAPTQFPGFYSKLMESCSSTRFPMTMRRFALRSLFPCVFELLWSTLEGRAWLAARWTMLSVWQCKAIKIVKVVPVNLYSVACCSIIFISRSISNSLAAIVGYLFKRQHNAGNTDEGLQV